MVVSWLLLDLFAPKLGDFVNLAVLFLTMWINSAVANPVIYRLVPSPFRLEIRQLVFTILYYPPREETLAEIPA